MDKTVLGIPLDLEDAEGLTISPIAALVVAQGMDSEGRIVYTCLHTDGMTSVEALGLAHYAKLHAETSVLRDSFVFEGESPEAQ
jgi:hypothetical protein